VTRVVRDVIPGRALGGRREAGGGGGLVLRIIGEMAVVLGVLGVGARVRGVPAPVLGGQVRDGRGLVAGVMLQGTGSLDVREQAASRVVRGPEVMGRPVMRGRPVVTGGRVVMGRPLMRGRPVVTGHPVMLGNLVVTGGPVVLGRPVRRGSPVITGARRGSGALGAAQAEAGRQTGLPVRGRPGRAKPGTETGPGRTAEHRGGAGRGPGHSGAETVAGKAAVAPESVHLLRGVAVIAERVARAPGRRAAAGLGRQAAARGLTGRGGSLVPGETIGTHGGCPAGSA
jgi:hypothetical protein